METDLTLVEKVKSGDMIAFSELVTRHQKSLLRLAYRVVGDLQIAQDVVQESFMKAYQKIGTFEGRSQFKSWVYQITLNTAKNKLRTRRPHILESDTLHLVMDEEAKDTVEERDLRDLIQEKIQKLPDKQRMALSLRIFDDLSFAEIAEVMKCPYDTAKANYRHALLKLRVSLSTSGDLREWIKIKEVMVADA